MKLPTLKATTYALTAVSVGLIVTSFFVPPMGIIDGSVLAAVGEIFGFAALLFGWHAIDKGMDAKITHGSTTIDIVNDEGEDNE